VARGTPDPDRGRWSPAERPHSRAWTLAAHRVPRRRRRRGRRRRRRRGRNRVAARAGGAVGSV